MSVWKLYIKKIVLAVVIVIVLIGGGILVLESNNASDKTQNDLQYINKYEQFVDECSSGEYKKALELAENFKEPYKSYYKDYVTYAMELDGWVGTEQELYAWLEDYFKFLDKSGYGKMEFPDEMGNQIQVWKQVYDIKIEFDENKEYFLEAFKWQPQYNEIVSTYYWEIYDCMWKNREFFKNEVVDGKVNIPISDSVELNEKAFDAYKMVTDNFEMLQANYKLNDDFKKLFEDELYMIKTEYECYSKYAITAIVNGDYREGDYATYGEEAAKSNYEVLSNAYRLNNFTYMSKEERDRGWSWEIFSGEELPEYVEDISAAAFDLYSIAKKCCPNAKIEIVESQLVSRGKIFDEIFSEDNQ